MQCKLVNCTKAPTKVAQGKVVATAVGVNVRDCARLEGLLDSHELDTSPREGARGVVTPSENDMHDELEVGAAAVNLDEANFGQLTATQEERFVAMLVKYRDQGLFPADPKRVPPCAREELRIPLLEESCRPHAAKIRRRSPEEVRIIQAEVEKLEKRGIIRPSTSTWAAECVTVRKKDGTVRICQDYRALNALMKTDSGGLGDVQAIFDRLRGSKYFSALDLAS